MSFSNMDTTRVFSSWNPCSAAVQRDGTYTHPARQPGLQTPLGRITNASSGFLGLDTVASPFDRHTPSPTHSRGGGGKRTAF